MGENYGKLLLEKYIATRYRFQTMDQIIDNLTRPKIESLKEYRFLKIKEIL